MSAHNFPKSRETRPVKIAELVQYRERLPEKLAYLADAPQKKTQKRMKRLFVLVVKRRNNM